MIDWEARLEAADCVTREYHLRVVQVLVRERDEARAASGLLRGKQGAITVTRIYTFEAAHQLPAEFGGPATQMHGHTYTLRVTVPGGTRTEDMDELWSQVVRPSVDHKVLNDVTSDTTVEGLAEWFARRFAMFTPPAVEVQEGRLRFARWEAS